MDRRIAPPHDFEYLLDKLIEPEQGKERSIFNTKQKILMFAASLGWKSGTRTPIDKRGTGIRFDIFEKALDDTFVNALAIAEEEDLEILSPEKDDERATIFEEYAHTGLKIIKEKCFDTAGDPLEILLQLTDDIRAEPDSDLPGMDPAILKGMVSE